VGAVIHTRITVFAQLLVLVVTHVPATTRSVKVSPAENLVSFNFKWQLNSSIFLI
jgi:hypothetical protein